jgi:hypothetical protein
MSFDNKTQSLEEIYSNLKKEIKIMKKEMESLENINYTQEEIIKAKKRIEFFNYNNEWLYSNFNTNNSSKNIEYPIIISENWTKPNSYNLNNLELRNLIFLSEEEINYSICNNEIKGIVDLKGESTFWIFLRTKEYFSKENVIILFKKEEYSQIIYLILGNFILNSKGNLIFTPFIKEQLILSNLNQKEKTIYEKNDYINLNIKIYDEGKDEIIVYTYLNNNKEENFAKGNFFIPINGNYKVMIAGSGQQCKLKQFSCDSYYKPKYAPAELLNEGKACNCCNII